jgi:hypothetical protein
VQSLTNLIQNTLYFIPFVGTIHQTIELCKLKQEFDELAKFIPSIRNLTRINSLQGQANNLVCRNELDSLSTPELKTRFSKYFEKENQVAILAVYGGTIREIICIAAQVLNPAFGLLAKMESLYRIYSVYNLFTGYDRYFYDSINGNTCFLKRKFFGISSVDSFIWARC